MMWLPKDERRLLAGYYSSIREIGTEKVYRLGDLASLLHFRAHKRAVAEYGDSVPSADQSDDLATMKREAVKYIDACNRIEKANSLLAARGLIKLTPHQHEIHVVVVGLSVQGYDLGRRYSNAFESSGMCFQEYRNHWIWLILAFCCGAVGAELIKWIGSLFN
jgi:hypothetical protein